jgi:hypothetical protein
MRVLMSGEVGVHYSQCYVFSGESGETYLERSFGGQWNGLCGAAEPGMLYLITGLHTGTVPFQVELHERAPVIDDCWEEVVEATFLPEGETALVEWGGTGAWALELDLVSHRVRYCARGMDQAHAKDTRMDGDPAPDQYLLQFWPAAAASEGVIRQTSEMAAYYHAHARTLPPPPPWEQIDIWDQPEEPQRLGPMQLMTGTGGI